MITKLLIYGMDYPQSSSISKKPPIIETEFGRWEEYLTPEQRLDAIAEIFVTIALRIVREQNEHTNLNS